MGFIPLPRGERLIKISINGLTLFYPAPAWERPATCSYIVNKKCSIPLPRGSDLLQRSHDMHKHSFIPLPRGERLTPAGQDATLQIVSIPLPRGERLSGISRVNSNKRFLSRSAWGATLKPANAFEPTLRLSRSRVGSDY